MVETIEASKINILTMLPIINHIYGHARLKKKEYIARFKFVSICLKHLQE